MIDQELLGRWMATFFGYGSWSARYWFIGLEEGGVDSQEEFESRIDAWHKAGEPDLLDLHDFHESISLPKQTKPGAALHRTWRPLLRVLFHARNKPFDNEDLRSYQIERLGRLDGETALLELSPFPAAKTRNRWFQRDPPNPIKSVDLEALKNSRREKLASAIDEHQPIAVVCYGDAMVWRDYFGLRATDAKFFVGKQGGSLIIATPQLRNAPANAHWDAIGRYIATQKQSTQT